MSTKAPPPPKVQEDDDLSSPRRRAATAEGDVSSTHHHQPKEEPSSSTYRRLKQELSSPHFQSAKSERRCLAEYQEKIAKRYAQWGRGLVQVQQSKDAVKYYVEQAEKPLARYRDDKDLDTMLKQKGCEDDPMLKYLSKKTSDVGDRPNNSNNAPVKLLYRGPDPQTNRFDIWSGYRWDGVDRSNNYEKKLFTSIANRYVQAQRTYL